VSRVFLLSPANLGGRRAAQALSPRATFALAAALRSPDGAPLGDLFTFVSGLYFRGKLAYARRFAQPPDPGNPIVGDGVHVITPNAGLRSPDTLVTHAAVRAFARGDIDVDNRRYRRPLEASARTLLAEIGSDCDVVLLGSVASPKYVCCCATRAPAKSSATRRSSARRCTAHGRRNFRRSEGTQQPRAST